MHSAGLFSYLQETIFTCKALKTRIPATSQQLKIASFYSTYDVAAIKDEFVNTVSLQPHHININTYLLSRSSQGVK